MTLRSVSRLGLSVAAAVPIPVVSRQLLRNRGVIFMLHRFRDPDRRVVGHDPEHLRRSLAYLRRHGYEVVALDELLRRLVDGEARGAIAFTIDDGYLDQATVAAPVFAEFGCPVTTFVTTGFLDGTMWFWWDRVAFAFAQTTARAFSGRIAEDEVLYGWRDAAERQQAADDFVARCKTVPDDEKERAIAELASETCVSLPATPPPEYAPMSWEDLRRCERRGMSFAPHTVTHPVLARVGEGRSAWEIAESWRRLQTEAAAPLPIFCYPNGQPGDFGSREYRAIADAGMVGAVIGAPGYAGGWPVTGVADGRFQLRRFALPDDVPTMAQYVSGLERLKHAILRRPD